MNEYACWAIALLPGIWLVVILLWFFAAEIYAMKGDRDE
jgi:hypothetical protein